MSSNFQWADLPVARFPKQDHSFELFLLGYLYMPQKKRSQHPSSVAVGSLPSRKPEVEGRWKLTAVWWFRRWDLKQSASSTCGKTDGFVVFGFSCKIRYVCISDISYVLLFWWIFNSFKFWEWKNWSRLIWKTSSCAPAGKMLSSMWGICKRMIQPPTVFACGKLKWQTKFMFLFPH